MMNPSISIKDYLKDRHSRSNTVLDKILPSAEIEPKKLHSAIRYAVLNGGKRLRPILLYAAGETFGAPLEKLDIPACALELIHCFSLVHDDLPAMDNDDFRRGKPTCHKAFDEATAILAGDGLQALAPKLLANCDVFNAETKLKMIKCLTERSWEMLLGQAMDLDFGKNNNPSLADLEKMYSLKTGALLSAAVELGIIAAEKDDAKNINLLRSFAKSLGLAYQIQDDIFDIAESTNETNPKLTYPALLGIDAAKKKVADLFADAIENSHNLSHSPSLLISLAEHIMNRKY